MNIITRTKLMPSKICFILFLTILQYQNNLIAQSHDQNYVMSSLFQVPLKNISESVILNPSNAQTTIDYYDYLGRNEQTVQREISPSKYDLVNLTEYDNVGRVYRQWIDVQSDMAGNYVSKSDFLQMSQSTYQDTCAFTELNYESSLLNRVIKERGVGQAWHLNNKCTNKEYLFNLNNNQELCVKKITYVSGTLNVGQYGKTVLYAEKTTD